MRRVAVVGAGVAGCAAAWAARRAGAEVLLVSSGPGATGQTSGAMDLDPWVPALGGAASGFARGGIGLDGPLAAFLTELFRVGFGEEVAAAQAAASMRQGCFAATLAGVVRPAAALDPAILNLGAVADHGHILVAEVGRPDFPAVLLSSALSASCQGRWRFTAAPLAGLFDACQVELPLAALSEQLFARGVAELLERCRGLLAERGADAILLGPWLGHGPAAVGALRSQRMLVGETTSPPEGPAGARLLRALARLTDDAGVIRHHVTVGELMSGAQGLELVPLALRVERVVVATGGLVGGGVVLPRGPGATFRVPLLPGLGDDVGSMDGYDASGDAGGFLLPGARHGLAPSQLEGRVLAAGDVMRGTRFSLLAAAESGLRAGVRAATLD